MKTSEQFEITETKMKLYNIYWDDDCGNRDYVATTNNLDKWLEDNNKDREEFETLDDFEIEEVDAYIYEKPVYVMQYIDDDIGLDFECVTTDVDAYLYEYNEERGFQPRDFDEDKDDTDDYDGEFVGRDYFDIQEVYVRSYEENKDES